MDGPRIDGFAFWKTRAVKVATLVSIMLLAASVLVFGVWLASGLSHDVGLFLELAAVAIIVIGWAIALLVLARADGRSKPHH